MLKPAIAGLLALSLAGCAGAAIEGANIARDQVVVDQNMDQARAGNAEAQYRVGDALCCAMVDDQSVSFYNTREAISWLCKAAAQGHGEATHKLGRIYAGDTVDGVRVMRRVAQQFTGTSRNRAIAYAWLRQAQANGNENARSRADSLWRDLTPAERAEATRIVESPQPIACQWDEVIRQSS